MAVSRTPGVSGMHGGAGAGVRTSHRPGPIAVDESLTDEDVELVLDLTQIALDVAGLADPTPLADGTNAVISATRGDWTGAAISVVSIVPLLGDSAKALKLPRYFETLSRAAKRAAGDLAFRSRFRPLFGQIAQGLETLRPFVPKPQRKQIDSCISALEKALGGRRLLPMRTSVHLERLAMQLLEHGIRHHGSERPIALYFGVEFPPKIPAKYWTVERLIERAPGGKEFLEYVADASFRDVEQMWQLLSGTVAKAASKQDRVDVFVKPDWFARMFPDAATSAAKADAKFVAGSTHRHSGRILDEAFNKIESLELRDVQFIAITPSGKEIARQKHRL